MDAMFATSTPPNEVDPFAPAPATPPIKKKIGLKKKKISKKPAVKELPLPPPEPESEVPQMPEVPFTTMEDSPMEEAMPCPPEPIQEPTQEPIEEFVSVETDEIAVDPSPDGMVLDVDTTVQGTAKS
jgi:hypothetical protein